ncbi:hypothetical protein OQZ33_18505 [Pedobacter sp. MC2016-05]|uniref:hypothetical protein n=1 Tax=Pedobacter sp. MC2016-05 TaxID=2994474 RepID=UPI002247F95C|nr:hypothetical protein [Pedobacter sp. MC2016-05]MCX2476332.1 hypothetical protein [Pedobacter sp. MC2016-05]
MNQNNLEYLQKSLDYLGFGTKLNAALENAISKGEQFFSIGINQRYIPAEFRSQVEKKFDDMHFELKFNRSKNGEVYFLNAMETSLLRYNATEPIVKKFVLDQQNRMSALQSYKLLCGLSFEKPTLILDTDDPGSKQYKKIDLWYKLNFNAVDKLGEHPIKWFFPKHGYDLEQSFSRFPFLELTDNDLRESAIKALRYGNLISLPMEIDGKRQEVYISAEPEDKTLNIYDQKMQSIHPDLIFAEKIRPVSPQAERSMTGEQEHQQGSGETRYVRR